MCGICFSINSSSSSSSSSFLSSSSRSLPFINNLSLREDNNDQNVKDILAEDQNETVGRKKEGEEELILKKKYLNSDNNWETIVESVKPRGPDYHGSFTKTTLVKDQYQYEMRFHASILHMRGDELTQQPFISDNGDVLLWNGEIFDGLDVGMDENDGQKLFDLLQTQETANFFSIIRSVEGPYAFIYFQAATNRIYFARDPLGRRSLLLHTPTTFSPYFYLSSNAPATEFELKEWEEIECDAIHCIDLEEVENLDLLVDYKKCITSFPRYYRSTVPNSDSLIYPFDRLLSTLPLPTELLPLDSELQPTILTPLFQSTIDSFLRHLESSVLARVATIPLFPLPPHARIAILFSGGIDCTLLAMMVDKVLAEEERIDLINVSFENPRKLRGNVNLQLAKKQTKLKEARKKAAHDKAKRYENGKEDGVKLESTEVFAKGEESGGKDEAPSLDVPLPLITTGSIYDGPDRITGRATLKELRELRPNRDWNFIEVDVTYQEMCEGRDKVIELLRPHRTVMDLSIAIAFFFAAKGLGHIPNPTFDPLIPTIPYQSNARVLFSGLGADELLGGYARHRRAFDKSLTGDWKGLIEELQMDLDRISIRNLGRDDRIISYHGKEARYPFLAGHFVDFACQTPVWLKVDPRGKEGLGDKLLLRQAARELGLGGASSLKKRAIHFGAGTAKMELGSGQDKGDHLLA